MSSELRSKRVAPVALQRPPSSDTGGAHTLKHAGDRGRGIWAWFCADWNEFPKTEKARCAASFVPAVTPSDAYGGYLTGTLLNNIKQQQLNEE